MNPPPSPSLLPTLQAPGPLSGKLEQLLRMVQLKYPDIARLAVALYDADSDLVRTFVAVDDVDNALPLYEAKLADVPWLRVVAETQTPRVINDFSVLEGSRKQHVQALLDAGYRASYTLPMCVDGRFFGFLFFNARSAHRFQDAVLSELDMLGHLASLVVYNERSNVNTLLATLRSAMAMTQARDPETGHHLERMSRYARLIAHRIASARGLDDSFVEHVYLFAPLHDLGKIATPDRVLLKPAQLTPDERALMRQHAQSGAQLVDQLLKNFGLSGVGRIEMLRNIVLHHHELYDGSGYPQGLVGEAIPIEARIVTVADVFDALTSARPYKPAWSNDAAISWMREHAGTQFDADCVEALCAGIDDIVAIQMRFRENIYG